MVAAVYDWSGFYVGVNGGWGSSQKSWDFLAGGAFVALKAATMPPAAPSAARSAIAGRLRSGFSAWKHRATGLISMVRNRSLLAPASSRNDTRVDAFGLFTGQVGVAFNNALLYVKGGAAVTSDRYRSYFPGTGVLVANSIDDTRWGGVVGVGLEYGFCPELVGRASSTITCSCRTRPTTSPTTVASARLARCSPTIASVRTSISSPSASTTAGVARSSRSTDLLDPIEFSYERPASRRPFCLLGFGRLMMTGRIFR